MATILHFHTGRGGRFHNAGFRSFCGTKNITEVLNQCDNSGQNTFIQNRDVKGRFCEPFYADCNGNFIISFKDAEAGVGTLNWDNNYDTDDCILLSECDAKELKLIYDSQEWNKESVLQEFFITHTDLKINWKLFDETKYPDLIEDYFNDNVFELNDYYNSNK
jgi:hypothetical protein